MIEFFSEIDFQLSRLEQQADWVTRVIESELKEVGEVSYIFCDDAYVLALNQDHLNHDTLTDIITFDYTEGNRISGDIFISIDRVKDNAEQYGVSFKVELQRVMIHGILHMIGYNDKSSMERDTMRQKEDEKLAMFHVEHSD